MNQNTSTNHNNNNNRNNHRSSKECDQEFKLVLTLDQFPTETSWVIQDTQHNAVVYSGGPYSEQDEEKTIEKNVCLSNDQSHSSECYKFTIFDKGRDGICCSFGQGSYHVYFQGKEIKSGGHFDDTESESTSVFGKGCSATTATSSSSSVITTSSSSSSSTAHKEQPSSDPVNKNSVHNSNLNVDSLDTKDPGKNSFVSLSALSVSVLLVLLFLWNGRRHQVLCKTMKKKDSNHDRPTKDPAGSQK